MADRPALSKGELEVARTLWGLGEATVREVFEAISAERKIEFSTVQTYLRRLETKGYLRTRQRGRTLVYSPRVQPKKVIRETVNDLVDRLFGGEAMPLLQHLIDDRGMSDEEIWQLREMLNRLEGQQIERSDK
jgi:predicted transcriptional regulator